MLGVARRSTKVKDVLLLGNNMIIPKDHWSNDTKVRLRFQKGRTTNAASAVADSSISRLNTVFVSPVPVCGMIRLLVRGGRISKYKELSIRQYILNY